MIYDNILFDLDGTLTDPGIGITNSVMYALKHFGIEVKERNQLYKFIGPPLLESFKTFYGFSDEQAQEGLKYYRTYYADKGIFENSVYEGLEDLLCALKRAGKKVMMATSKPEPFAIQIMKHFNLDGYFDFIGGSTLDEMRTNKAEVIQYVLDSYNVRDLGKTVMVGDREYDILGAKKCKLASIGICYGYGSRDELQQAGADEILETVQALHERLV